MTDIEDDLRQSLQRRADATPHHATPPAQVAGLARLMRRRRNRRVALGAAAAVVVVATGAATLQHLVGPGGSVAPATPPTTVTPVEPPSAPPTATGEDRTPTPLVTYPAGPEPRTALLVDGTYVPPAGEPSYPLPRPPRSGDIVAATRLVDGLLVSNNAYFEGTNGLFLSTASDITDLTTPCASGTGATNTDRTLAAWATFACPETGVAAPATVHLREADGTIRTQVVATPPNTNALIAAAGVLDDEVIVNRAFGSGAFITDLEQSPRDLVGVASVAAVNEARGTIAAELSTSGWGVLDAANGDLLFRGPQGSSLDQFSPDGDIVVARGLRRSNCTSIWFLDAQTGEERGMVSPESRCIFEQVVWEDATHVLAVVSTTRTTTTILRIGIDGDIEQAGQDYPAATSLVQ